MKQEEQYKKQKRPKGEGLSFFFLIILLQVFIQSFPGRPVFKFSDNVKIIISKALL